MSNDSNNLSIFRLLGTTLIAVQTLDYALCHYLALWTHKTKDEARALLETSLKKTLGALITALGKEDLVPAGLEDTLEAFRNERNWFVHHLYADNWEDTLHPTRCRELIQRIEKVKSESKRLAHLFTDLNEKWCRARGMTDSDLNEAMAVTLERMMKPQQRRP